MHHPVTTCPRPPFLPLALALALLAGCDGDPAPASAGAPPPSPRGTMTDPTAELETLRNARVYFNHHSVGWNMLQGLERLGPVPVTEVQLEKPAGFDNKGVVHSTLGMNTDPGSKIEGFKQALGRMSEPPDVAMMKFCFVDFGVATDVPALFARYQQEMKALQTRYPRTRFMHATVPLVIKKPGWKLLVKKVLGKTDDSYLNEQREAFSDLVRKSYPADRVFDLARLQATRPDGSLETFTREGRTVPALYGPYSNDGAHLGPAGADVLARAFASKMAAAVRASN